MPFDDDCRDVPKLPRGEVQTELVAGSRIENAAMASFCQSLTPEDWLALETLEQRVRNALLKQTVRIALRWRARR
jgi:hypothetical protein